MAEKFSVQAVFTAVDHFSGPVARMSDTLNKFNGKGGAGGAKGPKLSSTFKDAGAAMGRMGERATNVRNAVAAVGVAGAFAAHKMITAGADLEDALLSGSSKFGDGIRRNTPQFAELQKAALDLGRSTKFGAVEAASALNDLAASGFDPAAAMKNLPLIAQMAIAGGSDLQQASTIALDSMGAFGMLNDEMGNLNGPEKLATNLTRVADVMAYTANQTTADMNLIFETLKDAGSIGKLSGMTFEKFAAITGTLAQAGIKGTQAGTAIKNITVRLLSPTTEGDKELSKLKIDKKSFRKIKDPLEQLEIFSDALSKLSREDQIKALDEYFGKIPLAAAGNLATTGFRGARVLENKILANSGGMNASQAAIIGEGTSTKLGMLGNAFERINTSVFDKIKGQVEEATVAIIKFIDANEGAISDGFKNGVNWLKDNLPTIGKWLKYGTYAILGMQAAGALHSLVTFGSDLVVIAKGGAFLATKMWGAAAAVGTVINTLTMGQGAVAVITAMTGGLGALALAAGVAAIAVGSIMAAFSLNEDLKASTGGMGGFDIAGMMIHNAINGGSVDPAQIVSDHQDMLARKEYLARLNRDKFGAPGTTSFDDALGASHYGDLASPVAMMEMLGKLEQGMKLDPITIPPEQIKANPVDLQPIMNALAASIASSPPPLKTPAQSNAELGDKLDVNSNANVNVQVSSEQGTKARATSSGAHTKVNNHRTGTN